MEVFREGMFRFICLSFIKCKDRILLSDQIPINLQFRCLSVSFQNSVSPDRERERDRASADKHINKYPEHGESSSKQNSSHSTPNNKRKRDEKDSGVSKRAIGKMCLADSVTQACFIGLRSSRKGDSLSLAWYVTSL